MRSVPKPRRAGAAALVSAFFLVGLVATQAAAAQPVLDLVQISGLIDAPTAGYLEDRLDAADEEGVEAVVLQLDTPGGLEVSMRAMVSRILDESVPVIVWVAPRGARAASAGTFIAYAADLVYMAEATEIGAATPVDLSGRAPEELQTKVVNDAAAFIQELATTNGRNAEWAEAAVRAGASIGATEAADIGVVDGIASSLTELLQVVDGMEIEATGAGTLETWDEERGTPSVRIRFQQMTPIDRLLHAITDPEVAFFLLLIGTFGLIFEIYNPGIGLAGILGAIGLFLGFYALAALPTNWIGVALVIVAVLFFVVDLHTAGLGAWTAAGIASLIGGGLIIFAGAAPELALEPWAIVVGVASCLLFFVSVMTAALRVRLRRPITGEEGIVGSIAEAKTDIAPEGTVVTKGTLWRARTMETGIAAGSKVQVKATEGLVLLVEPLHDDGSAR